MANIVQANPRNFSHWSVEALKNLFPDGIPVVYRDGNGKWHSTSSYHNMPTVGYIPAADGQILCDAIPVAYKVNKGGEGMWFDPRLLNADIWGNLYVFSPEGEKIGYIPYEDDLVLITCTSCQKRVQGHEGHQYCSSCWKARTA